MVDLLNTPSPLLRPADLAQMLGVGRVTVWRWSKLPDFPKTIRLSERCIGWRLSDVEAWLESKAG
jgi:prophage regulatory protein